MRYAIVSLVLLGGCAAHVDPEQVDAVLALSGDATAGADVYKDHCEECHDADGKGEKDAPLPDDVPHMTSEDLATTVMRGPSIMPNFVNKLDDQQVADVVAYLQATFP